MTEASPSIYQHLYSSLCLKGFLPPVFFSTDPLRQDSFKKLQQLTRSADTGLFLKAVKTSSINGEGLLTELTVTFSEPVLE